MVVIRHDFADGTNLRIIIGVMAWHLRGIRLFQFPSKA
jgi:hypothetical protein